MPHRSMSTTSRLINSLRQKLGSQQANAELRWMKQASHLPLNDMLARRCSGEPLQYILGTQPFGSLELLVRQPVLIPRPETEDWVSNLAIRLRDTPFRPLRLIDLGTGTGCIPLLLASLLPPGSIRAVGVDISPDAVKLATENRDKCGIPDHAFQPVLADYTAPEFTQFMTQPYHVVTSNPPYISREEYIRLPTCVKDFEDRSALLGGEDGLFFYRAIANLIGRPNSLMAPNGMLVMEIGPTQAESVIDIMHKVAGLSKTQVWNDAAGHPRTVIAYKE